MRQMAAGMSARTSNEISVCTWLLTWPEFWVPRTVSGLFEFSGMMRWGKSTYWSVAKEGMAKKMGRRLMTRIVIAWRVEKLVILLDDL